MAKPKIEKRGFEKLVGLTIAKADQGAINLVAITTECGRRFEIDTEGSHHGIPILVCREVKEFTQ